MSDSIPDPGDPGNPINVNELGEVVPDPDDTSPAAQLRRSNPQTHAEVRRFLNGAAKQVARETEEWKRDEEARKREPAPSWTIAEMWEWPDTEVRYLVDDMLPLGRVWMIASEPKDRQIDP